MPIRLARLSAALLQKQYLQARLARAFSDRVGLSVVS